MKRNMSYTAKTHEGKLGISKTAILLLSRDLGLFILANVFLSSAVLFVPRIVAMRYCGGRTNANAAKKRPSISV